MKSIHLWVSGLAETGGIQHYSWCLARALRELYPQARLIVFSRNDKPGVYVDIAGAEVRCFGRYPGKIGHLFFTMAAISAQVMSRPDLCIAAHPAFAKALRWPARLGVRCIASAHGIEVWGAALQKLKSALADMTGIMPVSDFTREVLIREGGLAAARIAVVPDTVREDFFLPGPKPVALLLRHGISAQQPVLLTVGRLHASEAYKGQDQVIAALPEIRRAHPEVRFIIAGTGDDEPRLRRLVAELAQEDAVIFAGFVPEAELSDYYRLCDVFVMPSTGEGFGIVYLEALASGRPCIVGNRDASPEAILHGRLGFVVDPRSPSEIAEAAVKLLSHQHDKPWLNDAQTVRAEMLAAYGFEAFKRRLSQVLHQLN